MLLNGFGVAASLLRKGEDPVLTRTVLANMFNLNKGDLTAAREKTGCYSLTRYHLNAAAEFLGRSASDLNYRVTPNMLKTDGDRKNVAMTGQDATDLGAQGLDAGADYTAELTSNTSVNRLVGDQIGKLQGGSGTPAQFQTRLDLLLKTADEANGSLVAAMMGFCGESVFIRYNVSHISSFKYIEDRGLSDDQMRAVAGITHLCLGIYGAASTGVALGLLRKFIATGEHSLVRETTSLSTWMSKCAINMMGTRPRIPSAELNDKAKFSDLADYAKEASKRYSQSDEVGNPVQNRDLSTVLRAEGAVHNKLIESFMKRLATAYTKRESKGDELDVDLLIKKANELLANTPQMIRKQV